MRTLREQVLLKGIHESSRGAFAGVGPKHMHDHPADPVRRVLPEDVEQWGYGRLRVGHAPEGPDGLGAHLGVGVVQKAFDVLHDGRVPGVLQRTHEDGVWEVVVLQRRCAAVEVQAVVATEGLADYGVLVLRECAGGA